MTRWPAARVGGDAVGPRLLCSCPAFPFHRRRRRRIRRDGPVSPYLGRWGSWDPRHPASCGCGWAGPERQRPEQRHAMPGPSAAGWMDDRQYLASSASDTPPTELGSGPVTGESGFGSGSAGRPGCCHPPVWHGMRSLPLPRRWRSTCLLAWCLWTFQMFHVVRRSRDGGLHTSK